jgi:hypothetical protein
MPIRAWGIGAIGAFAVLALGGCETGPIMSPAECAGANWEAVGYADGAEGRSRSTFGDRLQVCANAGYSAQESAYQIGYSDGVRVFCQPSRGFRLGDDGGALQVACPPDLAPAFEIAYRDGRDLYRARSAYESAESTFRALLSERDDVQRKLVANEIGLDASTTDADIARHRAEVQRLSHELIRIDRRLREADYEARILRDDYQRLQWRLR